LVTRKTIPTMITRNETVQIMPSFTMKSSWPAILV
jgi:hypothetical protein